MPPKGLGRGPGVGVGLPTEREGAAGVDGLLGSGRAGDEYERGRSTGSLGTNCGAAMTL